MAKVKKKKKFIIIAVVLAVLLVGTGVFLLVTTNQDKEPKEKQTEKNSRCVNKICIYDVSVEDIDGSKSVSAVLKNEGKKTVESECVNLLFSDKKYTICLNDVKANEELKLNLEYTETIENEIDDYSLEKASEQEAKEANKKREEILNNLK